MKYVEVPVPPELVEEVEIFLRWNTRPQQPTTGDLGMIPGVLAGLDATCREICALVAEAKRDGEELPVGDVARRLRMNKREVMGAVFEINSAMVMAGGPAFAVMFKDVPGDNALPDRLLFMAEDVAAAVRAALRR